MYVRISWACIEIYYHDLKMPQKSDTQEAK